MYSCKIEGRQVVLQSDVQASVWQTSWRKLVNVRKVGTTLMGTCRYTVVWFETKSGTPEDAINTPGGTWLLHPFEAQSFGF